MTEIKAKFYFTQKAHIRNNITFPHSPTQIEEHVISQHKLLQSSSGNAPPGYPGQLFYIIHELIGF